MPPVHTPAEKAKNKGRQKLLESKKKKVKTGRAAIVGSSKNS